MDQKLTTTAIPSGSEKIESQTDPPLYFLVAHFLGIPENLSEESSLTIPLESFWINQDELAQDLDSYEQLQWEGNTLKAIARQAEDMLTLLEDLLHSFKKFRRRRKKENLKGLRILLGHGIAQKVKGKFEGKMISETLGLERPMIDYIEIYQEEKTQIWCTKSFAENWPDHDSILFEDLGELDFSDEYEPQKGFRVILK